VDVFIPTYSEGAEILEETIRAALALDYPACKLNIWMLDDSRRPWLKELCSRYGAGYFARPTNEHGKAGNLNYAFPRTSGEFIVVIDADFVLHKDFIYRTLGFLVYEDGIGLVQTPQHFRNPDPIQHNLMGNRAWTEEQHFFMTMVESGRDSYGNAFCVGSGWIVRRSILLELGGFPQGSICEDLEISYVLKARGQRTLFLNEPLAIGLAPESLPEYIKQRVRWCSGTMQHLYLSTGPFRARGLTLLDRMFYFEAAMYWLTYPFIVWLLVAPVVFWFTGVAAIPGGGDEVFLILIPRFVAGYILIYWMSEWKVIPPIAMIHRSLASFYISATLIKSFISPFGSPFKVTSKGQSRAEVVIQWKILRGFLVLALFLILGMFINLSGYYQVVAVHDLTTLDILWSLYSLVVLGLCMVVCIELPKNDGYLNAETEVRNGSARQSALAMLRRLRGRLS
jgi:cellulose synthase (UDP-forming)